MRLASRWVFALWLMGCSTTNIIEAFGDGGVPPAERPGASSPDGAASAAPGEDSPSVDAGAIDAFTGDACAVHYVPPPSATGPAIYENPPFGGCDIACGAGGPYGYGTGNPTLAPPFAGCTHLVVGPSAAPTGFFCCPSLVCTRRPSFDGLCPASNPGHPLGYLCDGPDGEARPTRAGCERYVASGPDDGTEFCCVN